MRTCPRCNNTIYRSKKAYNPENFCSSCGKNLTQPESLNNYEIDTYDTTPTTYHHDPDPDLTPLDTYDNPLH